MQVTCPNCSQLIRAENINIQDMAAVCANCNTVFQFSAPEAKTKRRKVKQPENLALRDAQKLEMRFRTNWRLGSNEQFVGFLIGGSVLSFVSTLFVSESLAGEIPIIVPIATILAALFLMYSAGLEAYNHTEIAMDDEKITVARKPLPNLFNPKKIVTLHGVETIQCEETPTSIKEGYDLARFRVWAETPDGVRRIIVTDVTEEYAYFIAQRLEERLNADLDVTHLHDQLHDETQDSTYLMNKSQSEAKKNISG